jgi:hypothetical protein
MRGCCSVEHLVQPLPHDVGQDGGHQAGEVGVEGVYGGGVEWARKAATFSRIIRFQNRRLPAAAAAVAAVVAAAVIVVVVVAVVAGAAYAATDTATTTTTAADTTTTTISAAAAAGDRWVRLRQQGSNQRGDLAAPVLHTCEHFEGCVFIAGP